MPTLNVTGAIPYTYGPYAGYVRANDLFASLDTAPEGGDQLPVGNFSARSLDPIQIYPRPDAETNVWAKHRRHHPEGGALRIPIGVSYGAGPFWYELISGPAGSTVGTFLTVSGDKLIVNPDYGVFVYNTPVLGSYTVTVRVHFQDGFAPMDITWGLEITTAGTIFMDSSVLDNSGDGSFANPFKDGNSWLLNNDSDITYSGYQVCYLGGTHDVAMDNTITGTSYGNWDLSGANKPLVHYGKYGTGTIFDMSNTTIGVGGGAAVVGQHGSDMSFTQIVFQGLNALQSTPKHFFIFGPVRGSEIYNASESGARVCFYDVNHKDMIVVNNGNDNSGPIWATRTTPANNIPNYKRHFWYCNRVTFENCYIDVTAPDQGNTNFNGYYLSNTANWLDEHTTAINTKFGKNAMLGKTGVVNKCTRFADYTLAPSQQYKTDVAGTYDLSAGGPWEVSYSKFHNDTTSNVEYAFYNNSGSDPYNIGDAGHLPLYLTRCTLLRSVAGKDIMRNSNGWPVVYDGNVFVGDDVNVTLTGDNLTFNLAGNPLDVNSDLTGATRTASLGKYGAEVAS